MWAFLALAVLPDVAHWRFPRPPRERVLATDLTRHVFGRLWWRAQLVHDAGAAAPYAALNILGEAAFDQIYARRKALGGSPHLVRSILRVWNTLTFENLNEREILRDFLKRLLRLAPFVVFEALEDGELDEELAAVAAEAVAAARSARTPEEPPSDAGGKLPPVAASAHLPGSRPSTIDVPPEKPSPEAGPTFLDVCAGAGGLALGLEQAGFTPVMLIDNRSVACETLRLNRPNWDVREIDLIGFEPDRRDDYAHVRNVDLLSAGLPRLKGAAAVNRGRGNNHELDVLRATLDITAAVRPRALLIENIPNLVTDGEYEPIRQYIAERLESLGFRHRWCLINAVDHGVPQDRKQGVLVAFTGDALDAFQVPEPTSGPSLTVGETLATSMAARGWPQAEQWAVQADQVAPTLVGGSWDRGGPDLGPTGSKRKWARMGVDGGTVANDVPGPGFRWAPDYGRYGMIALTVEQTAQLQAFPREWQFAGRKTARYRQVGHASPPPVGAALGRAIRSALEKG
ncbi:hypothetical protein HCC30_14310 [Streptomyces sp. HNM0574]|nr:hypothetical protein [Streptomyces sp. HNM0574]